ncbi:MAG: hypothetical protein ACHQRM_12430 [Bacteroidia bacterium]
MKRILFFFSLLYVFASYGQDTLIWSNGNKMVVDIVSSDSIVRYRDYAEPNGEVFIIRHNELAFIHFADGHKETGAWSAEEQKKIKAILALQIHPFLLMYKQAGDIIGEPEMLSFVEYQTKNKIILDQIGLVRKARKAQASVMLTGLGMFGLGVVIIWRSSARYLNAGTLVGFALVALSIPVEASFVIPYTLRKVRANRVKNLYNATLFN